MELHNNTILLTGGTSGIGLELAKQLLDLGNTVIITGRDQAKLDQTKSQLPQVHTFQSDVSDPKAIMLLYQAVIRQFPDLNVLINNAGIMLRLNLHDSALNVDNIVQEIETNLSGPIRMVQQFLPHLKTKQSAAILNVTSGISLVPFPLSPIYGATKSGLHSYTQSLRVQLKKTNIRVFELVAPAVNTPLNDKFADDVSSSLLMEPDKLVKDAIKGMKKDKPEIFPGIAIMMKLLSRVAPALIFNQMSKMAEKALGQASSQPAQLLGS